MLITKVLKKTTGEDNKKTEMYEYHRSNPNTDWPRKQVYDSKSHCPHGSHCVGRDLGKLPLTPGVLETRLTSYSRGFGQQPCSVHLSLVMIMVLPVHSGLLLVAVRWLCSSRCWESLVNGRSQKHIHRLRLSEFDMVSCLQKPLLDLMLIDTGWKFRTRGPCCLHDLVLGEQYLCLRQHVARCCCCHYCCVRLTTLRRLSPR